MKIHLTVMIHIMSPNGDDSTRDDAVECEFPIDVISSICKPMKDDLYQSAIVVFNDGEYGRLHMKDKDIDNAIKIIKEFKGEK